MIYILLYEFFYSMHSIVDFEYVNFKQLKNFLKIKYFIISYNNDNNDMNNNNDYNDYNDHNNISDDYNNTIDNIYVLMWIKFYLIK